MEKIEANIADDMICFFSSVVTDFMNNWDDPFSFYFIYSHIYKVIFWSSLFFSKLQYIVAISLS